MAGKIKSEFTHFPVLFFKKRNDWEAWLDVNHSTSSGIRIKFAKKISGLESLTYNEALEVSLCYGWIDGQINSLDDSFWLQRFMPRGSKSMWSKRNKEKVEQLMAEGRVKPEGLQAIENAKLNGKWDLAYDSPKNSKVPPDFQAELDKNEPAKSFFESLDSANRYAVLYRIQTAGKEQTRQSRIQKFIHMLERNEKIHP